MTLERFLYRSLVAAKDCFKRKAEYVFETNMSLNPVVDELRLRTNLAEIQRKLRKWSDG